MKKILLGLLGLVLSCLSACTGIEAGGKVWITRVDQRQESQQTHNVPLKCYLWADCSQPVENLK
jgi:hypothetical protein